MGWKIACFFFISVIGICVSADAEQSVVHGKIKFVVKELTRIPKDSCLTLKVEDSQIADAASTQISKRILKNEDLKVISGSMSYNITFKPPANSVEYTVSATLNMGWCPSGGDDWLHDGDYLTTTSYTFDVKPSTQIYEKDIEMEFYGSRSEDNHQKKPKERHHHPKHDAMNKNEDPCQNAPCYNSICISFPNGTYSCKKLEKLPCAVPMCTAIYQPVCGSNGKTYSNECVMDGDSCISGVKTNLYKLHDGECYSRRSLHEGFLLGAGVIALATTGLIVIFFVWRRNGRKRMELSPEYMKNASPYDM